MYFPKIWIQVYIQVNNYNNGKYYDYPLVVVTDTHNLIQEFEGVFLHVTKNFLLHHGLTSFISHKLNLLAWVYVSFQRVKDSQIFWESPSAVTLQNALIYQSRPFCGHTCKRLKWLSEELKLSFTFKTVEESFLPKKLNADVSEIKVRKPGRL